MADVIQLHPTIERADAREPDPEIIRMLEFYLEKAKAGEIRSIAIAAERIMPNEHSPGSCSSWHRAEGGNSFILLGSLYYLVHRLGKALEEHQ